MRADAFGDERRRVAVSVSGFTRRPVFGLALAEAPGHHLPDGGDVRRHAVGPEHPVPERDESVQVAEHEADLEPPPPDPDEAW